MISFEEYRVGRDYKVGQQIEVRTPHGWMLAKVRKVIPNWGWSNETRYEVTGKGIESICSALSIRMIEEVAA